MAPTAGGSLRPAPVDGFSPDEEAAILSACPGTIARPRTDGSTVTVDPIWGAYNDLRYAWAADPDIRFRAATGGVLTALGCHLLTSRTAEFILHVGAIPGDGLHTQVVMSESPSEVVANAGSRYGPTAPLAGLRAALDRGVPFAIIAKPCDLGAVHAYASTDPRVDELCVSRLAMVCGGQSRLEKSTDLLADFGVALEDVNLFRHRGYGNPGRTRIETHDGRAFEATYLDMWADASTWKLEARCTLCPDALGEAADVAALDVWPGGTPTGEDAGFNGIVVRTESGRDLVASATAAGDLVLGQSLDAITMNDMQPHQWSKKERLTTRFAALADAGRPTIDASGLRLKAIAESLDAAAAATEVDGTRRRIREGRYDG